MGVVKRFSVFLVALDPTVGSEIQKTRPCVIISPDEMNDYIRTVIVAPMTTKGREYRTRIALHHEPKLWSLHVLRPHTLGEMFSQG